MSVPAPATPVAAERQAASFVESDSLEPVALDQRQHWRVPALIFGGLEFTIPVLMVGAALVADYSMATILWVLVVALAIQWIGNALQGHLGARTGLSSSFLARQSFGELQARVVVGSTLALLSMGWWAVQTAVTGNALAAMLGIDYATQRTLWALITVVAGVLFAVPAVLGYSSVKWTDYLAVPAGLALIAAAIYYALSRTSLAEIFAWQPAGTKSFLAGVSVVLGVNVAQWVIAADYTRYSRPQLADQIKIPLGIVGVGLPLFYAGALMAVGIGNADIVHVMSELGVPFWGFLILWLASWTSQLVNNYSMGLALANVCGRTSNRDRMLLTIAGTVVALLLALAGLADHFIDFLLATAVLYPAFAGVMFADFFLLRRAQQARRRAWNWRATIAATAGVAVGYLTQYLYPVGIPALHSLFVTGLLYLALERAADTRSAVPASGRRVEVVIVTRLGEIAVELYPDRAPITVANFLRYVDENRYRGATFYRTVRRDNDRNPEHPIEVIQGGTNHREPMPLAIVHEATEATGLRHLDGTISMARYAAGTASSEFFICIGSQPNLDFGAGRNADRQGFAAFGRVISGMPVVRRIHSASSGAPADDSYVRGQILDEPVEILSIRRR